MGQRHVCTFRLAQRAAYRTAISAAQTCYYYSARKLILNVGARCTECGLCVTLLGCRVRRAVHAEARPPGRGVADDASRWTGDASVRDKLDAERNLPPPSAGSQLHRLQPAVQQRCLLHQTDSYSRFPALF